MTPAAGRNDGLTRLRLIFIGWVVVFHLDLLLRLTIDLPWLRPLIGAGYLGVDGFFLLSGFVLWLGYGSRPPTGAASLGQFWLRRFARTWPLHILVLLALAALVCLVIATGGRIHDPERFGMRDFLLQAVLVHAWEMTERLTWNSPSWALSVEWAGYLAFPLLVHAWRQVPAFVLLPVAGLCLAGLWVMAELSPGVGLNLNLHLGLLRFFLKFAMGLSLGRLATESRLPTALPLLAGSGLVAGLLFRYDALAVAGLGALIAATWQRGAVGSPLKKSDLSLRLGEALLASTFAGSSSGWHGRAAAGRATQFGRASPAYGDRPNSSSGDRLACLALCRRAGTAVAAAIREKGKRLFCESAEVSESPSSSMVDSEVAEQDP